MSDLLPWPDVHRLPTQQRVRHAPCPVCGRMVRTGWSSGHRVIGQHHPAAEAALDVCCDAQPCAGSLTPVPEDDCIDAGASRALAAITTGAMPAVFTGAITGQLTAVPPADATRSRRPPAQHPGGPR